MMHTHVVSRMHDDESQSAISHVHVIRLWWHQTDQRLSAPTKNMNSSAVGDVQSDDLYEIQKA